MVISIFTKFFYRSFKSLGNAGSWSTFNRSFELVSSMRSYQDRIQWCHRLNISSCFVVQIHGLEYYEYSKNNRHAGQVPHESYQSMSLDNRTYLFHRWNSWLWATALDFSNHRKSFGFKHDILASMTFSVT